MPGRGGASKEDRRADFTWCNALSRGVRTRLQRPIGLLEPSPRCALLRLFTPPRRGSHKSAQGNALGMELQMVKP